MISENGFRAILGLPTETPFETGFRHGVATGLPASARQVAEHYGEITTDDLERYLNGRDDGVAGDGTRITPERAALLWPVRNWRDEAALAIDRSPLALCGRDEAVRV